MAEMSVLDKLNDTRRSGTGFVLTGAEASAMAKVHEIAEMICQKLESESLRVTILDQEALRKALTALS